MLDAEDVALFVNAASTCTGQSEFYGDAGEQQVSLGFLHAYMFFNYRRLYALCLAAGINHFNKAAIVHRLLAAGAPPGVEARREEGALIAGVLRELPPQRVYRLFASLRRDGVNNRRTRATVKRWLSSRRDLTFDAVKYRGHLRSVARHTHQSMDPALHDFLFEGPDSRKTWEDPLLDAFRRARYEDRALYELPYTVAEGLAAARGIDRKRFLERIAPKMTRAERARVERQVTDTRAKLDPLELERLPLDRLCVYALNQPLSDRDETLDAALNTAARRAWSGSPVALRRVHAVLDDSFSTRSGLQKRNRSLAVALGCGRMLAVTATDYRSFWTSGATRDLHVRPRGQTDLATPLLEALRGEPDLVVVVSDGFENDPPGAAGEVLRLFRAHIDPHGRTRVVHLNPVFDAHSYMPRPLGPGVPTVGIREAGELPLKLGFASFAVGGTRIEALQDWLHHQARPWLEAS